MLNPNGNFFQARLKHIWATQHINQLHALWQGFLKTDFCHLTVEDNPETGSQRIRVTSVERPPVEIVLTLGDAIHNLRCALDYTVSEILGWKDTRLTFPMGEEREELISSFRTEVESVGRKTKGKGRNAAIELAVPGIGNFIVEKICSYKAAGGFLWALGKLDACDKHRLLTPVVVPQTISGINAVDDGYNRLENCSATIDAGGTFTPYGMGSGLKIESYGKPTAEIFFSEAGIVEGQPVFPTLIQMSQAVAETINRIDEFVTAAGWSRSNS